MSSPFMETKKMKLDILHNFHSTMFGSAVQGNVTPDISKEYAAQLVGAGLCKYRPGDGPNDGPGAPAADYLADMTVAKLKAYADELGVALKDKAKKAEIVEALEADQKAYADDLAALTPEKLKEVAVALDVKVDENADIVAALLAFRIAAGIAAGKAEK